MDLHVEDPAPVQQVLYPADAHFAPTKQAILAPPADESLEKKEAPLVAEPPQPSTSSIDPFITPPFTSPYHHPHTTLELNI